MLALFTVACSFGFPPSVYRFSSVSRTSGHTLSLMLWSWSANFEELIALSTFVCHRGRFSVVVASFLAKLVLILRNWMSGKSLCAPYSSLFSCLLPSQHLEVQWCTGIRACSVKGFIKLVLSFSRWLSGELLLPLQSVCNASMNLASISL